MSYNARKSFGTVLYNDKDYTNEQSIAFMRLKKPDVINRVLTYTEGMNDDDFPLTMLTEGNGLYSNAVKLNDVEFTWQVMGKATYNDVVVKGPDSAQPGRNGQVFHVWFASRKLIEQYGLIGPDGESRVRIMEKPIKDAIGYRYTLQIKNPDPNAYINPDLFAPGNYWTMTIPTVPESYSRGNRAISMSPTNMKGQIGFHRFSKEIAGNAANTVVQYEFRTRGGGTTNLWINEEMRQFDNLARTMREEGFWLQEYNRLPDGQIVMKDFDNGNPIPESAGMLEICRNSNFDTYGYTLPLEKVERVISDIFQGTSADSNQKDIILFAGEGFRRDFTRAVENKALAFGWQALGDKFITGEGNNLMYGGSFSRYQTPSGKVITIKPLNFVDNGSLAKNDIANGRLHPATGLPISSHRAYFIDASSYNGERNIKMAQMKGQEWIEGIYKGLTPIPPSWGVVQEAGNRISTDVDASRYEVKMSAGLHVSNSEKFFAMESQLD